MKHPVLQAGGQRGNERRGAAAIFVVATLLFLTAGCKSTPEGALTPRPGKAYLDFYTEAEAGTLSWDIQKYDPVSKRHRILFSEIKPTRYNVVRVQLPPGEHQVRVAFLNQPIKLPATLKVSAREGMVTPIKVALTEGQSGTFQQREQRYGPTARGHYGRITEVRTIQGHAFEVTAKASDPVAYVQRDQMPYARSQYQ